MNLVEAIYELSRTFPNEERFALTAQVRRAGVSIPSNIAEGQRRGRSKPFINHLEIALGSQAEVDVQIEIARRLGYCSSEAHVDLQQRIDRVGRMLNGLITSLKRSRKPREQRRNGQSQTTNH